MKRSNPHTHSLFSDGRNTLWETADTARALGFISLGFSEHSTQNPQTGGCGMTDEKAYIEGVRSLSIRFNDMRIWLGVELDLYGTCERNRYDYVLGAVHYLKKDGCYCPVDGSKEKLRAGIDSLYGGSGLAAARAYYRSVSEMIDQIRPDIVAHYDLIAKNNGDGSLFNEVDPDYRGAALEALETARDAGCLLEINTGGMARGRINRPYPALFLLKKWREMGGRVILSSDCHDARYLAYGFDEARELAREAGFTSIVRLGGMGEAMFVEEAAQQTLA